jgi:LysR family transcriptional regulator, glycine cleavage system transcriptional activator
VRRSRALLLSREAEDYLAAIRTAFDDLRRATARLQRRNSERLLSVRADGVASGEMAAADTG